jgi:ssDNA thymidine ADP-ribosyltransferase, DarT
MKMLAPDMLAPANPKICHIVHWDKLASMAADGWLWSDASLATQPAVGTMIGMSSIKARRMNELRLSSHPDLFVGQCVPFYFCPRSVMLYLIHKQNAELAHQGGQEPIVHLVADMRAVVDWANANQRRWAFTLSNAGSRYFQDRADLAQLDKINWSAVQAHQWSGSPTKEEKQAEFLMEQQVPWHLIEEIGVFNQAMGQGVMRALAGATHKPTTKIQRDWYY